MAAFLFSDTDASEIENLPRRERGRLLQRREILDAALKLFSEKGYHNVSIHEIAKEAEFGIGTLYKFFANKRGAIQSSHHGSWGKVSFRFYAGS